MCALLRHIVAGKGIAQLPGGAQRMLLQMLEEVASHVSDSQQNINVLRGLVEQLRSQVNVESQKCWGKPLGSQSLWEEHLQTIERIQEITSQIKIKEVSTFLLLSSEKNNVTLLFTYHNSLVQIFVQNYMTFRKNVYVK